MLTGVRAHPPEHRSRKEAERLLPSAAASASVDGDAEGLRVESTGCTGLGTSLTKPTDAQHNYQPRAFKTPVDAPTVAI